MAATGQCWPRSMLSHSKCIERNFGRFLENLSHRSQNPSGSSLLLCACVCALVSMEHTHTDLVHAINQNLGISICHCSRNAPKLKLKPIVNTLPGRPFYVTEWTQPVFTNEFCWRKSGPNKIICNNKISCGFPRAAAAHTREYFTVCHSIGELYWFCG